MALDQFHDLFFSDDERPSSEEESEQEGMEDEVRRGRRTRIQVRALVVATRIRTLAYTCKCTNGARDNTLTCAQSVYIALQEVVLEDTWSGAANGVAPAFQRLGLVTIVKNIV